MTAPYRAVVTEGDRYLELAQDTYRGGGDYAVVTAQAAIAAALFARAALERPDTFGMVLEAAQRKKEQEERQAAKESGRHPAGSKLGDNA